MPTYIIRRLLLIIPTLFLVTVISFFSIRFIPGDVIDLMASQMAYESGMGAELTVEHIRQALGLDVPVHIQYVRWLGGAFRGDIGDSLWTKRPVREMVLERLPVTLELGCMAIIVGILISIPVGVWSAIRQDKFGDYAGRTAAILFISIPTFWLGTMVIVYPSVLWNWAPSFRYVPFTENPLANLGQCALPAVILGMALTGTAMRMTRTMMLEVLRQDYIRTAWSKGLRERVIIIRHAMKNALIPVISQIGLLIAALLAMTVVIEQIFALPGIGLLLIEVIRKRDYPVIVGINLVMATFVLAVNLLVDLSYAYLDPRIQY